MRLQTRARHKRNIRTWCMVPLAVACVFAFSGSAGAADIVWEEEYFDAYADSSSSLSEETAWDEVDLSESYAAEPEGAGENGQIAPEDPTIVVDDAEIFYDDGEEPFRVEEEPETDSAEDDGEDADPEETEEEESDEPEGDGVYTAFIPGEDSIRVTVTLTDPAALPADAQLVVEFLPGDTSDALAREQFADVVSSVGFQLVFLNAEGERIQPECGMYVDIQI